MADWGKQPKLFIIWVLWVEQFAQNKYLFYRPAFIKDVKQMCFAIPPRESLTCHESHASWRFFSSHWLFDSQFSDFFRAVNSPEITLIVRCSWPQHKEWLLLLDRRSRPRVVNSQTHLNQRIAWKTFHLWMAFSLCALDQVKKIQLYVANQPPNSSCK